MRSYSRTAASGRVGAEHAQAFARPRRTGRCRRAGAPLIRSDAGQQRVVGAAAALGMKRVVGLRQLFGALARFADAGRRDRVRLQVIGRAFALAALVAADHGLQLLEEVRHRLRVVAAAGQRADADAVGFGFVAAGVVDLALHHQPLRRTHRRHRGVVAGAAVGRLRDRDRAEHRQQDRDAVALRPLHRPQHVRLGDMGDFVRQHRGDFVLAVGRQDQAGVDRDIAAQRRERIDLAVPAAGTG